MAHTKAKGTTKLGRDSESKRLGVKIFGGSKVGSGQIIIRQRGTKYSPGNNVRRGGDDTLYAVTDGFVAFKKTNYKNFNGNSKRKQIVSVVEKGPVAVIPKGIAKKSPAKKTAINKTKSSDAPKEKSEVGVPTSSSDQSVGASVGKDK